VWWTCCHHITIYQDHAQALHDPAVRTAKEAAEDTAKKAAARTAKESMSRAADKVKELNKPDKEGTYNIAVSGDGTFIFRSGYCSLHSHWKGIGLWDYAKWIGWVQTERGKEGTVSLMSGGNNTNTNAKHTLQVLLALLILQVCWQYSWDQLHSTIPSKWSFSDMGSVKPITFLSRKMSMVM